MSDLSVDFAVFGASGFAVRLATALSRTKSVVLIGRRASPQRLPRGVDLALPLATRPATWRQLRRGTSETPGQMKSATVIADTAAGAVALDHVAHMALTHGLPVRRRPSGWLFPKIPVFAGERFVGETREGAVPEFDATGTARLQGIEASRIILADDSAILDILPEAQRPPMLAGQSMTATLTLSAKRLAAPIVLFPERGVTLVQHTSDTVLALVSGEHDVDARLASALPGPFPVRRTATSRFRRLVTRDGAPLIGLLPQSNLFLCAGLGDAAPFFAPAIARVLLGEADAEERAWAAAHDPSEPRDLVAEVAL